MTSIHLLSERRTEGLFLAPKSNNRLIPLVLSFVVYSAFVLLNPEHRLDRLVFQSELPPRALNEKDTLRQWKDDTLPLSVSKGFGELRVSRLTNGLSSVAMKLSKTSIFISNTPAFVFRDGGIVWVIHLLFN